MLKEKADLQGKILELRKDSDNNKEELEKAKKEISCLTTKIETMNARISILETDISDYLTELKEKDQKIENERNSFNTFIESQKQIASKHETTLDGITSVKDEMKILLTGIFEYIENWKYSIIIRFVFQN